MRESAVEVSIEVLVAIMSRPITSYFATISREEFLTQAAAGPLRVLPATVPQLKKKPETGWSSSKDLH